LTGISFEYDSRDTYARFRGHDYIATINQYLYDTKCDSVIKNARFYDRNVVISFDKSTVYHHEDQINKLDRMGTIRELVEDHYDLVDFEENEYDLVLKFKENKNALRNLLQQKR
jgi:hypothetical protein